jgi:hypothetical protein
MSIEEGNKLIAEFMGLKSEWKKYPNPQLDRLEVDKGTHWDEAKYHTSWDWLMPVVEKIENSKHSNYGEKIKFFVFSMAQFHCSIIGHTGIRQPGCYYQTPYGYEPPSKIMAVWEAVIGFIQWYNSNNTNQINSK